MSFYDAAGVVIPFLCSNASQRVIHASFFSDSQGTRPALKMITSQATMVVGPNAVSTTSTWQSSGTSTGPGLYHLVLTQSECSAQGVPGYAMLYTSSGTIGAYNIRLYFPRVDSYDTTRMGLVALPNAPHSTAGGLITEGTGTGQLSLSGGSVGLKAQTHSDVTIKGIQNYANISSVTLNAGTHSGATLQGLSNYANISNVTLHAGTHSNVTIQGLSNYANISRVTLHPGTHSDVTVQGVTRVNSGVTLNADTHSGATVQGVSNYANISNVTLHPGTHSNVTIQGIGPNGIVAGSLAAAAITSAKFAAGAIDAVALATDAGQEIADRILLRGIAGGNDSTRSVGQALAVLRNKVEIVGTTLTVYDTDDTTVLYTAAITAGSGTIAAVDPT